MKRILALVLLAILPASITAEQIKPRVIPSPKAVLGFEPGTSRTIADWKQISTYFAQLDAASDRVRVETLGTSTEGRELIVAFISAPDKPSISPSTDWNCRSATSSGEGRNSPVPARFSGSRTGAEMFRIPSFS